MVWGSLIDVDSALASCKAGIHCRPTGKRLRVISDDAKLRNR